MNLICTLENLRKTRFVAFALGAFMISLGGSIALGVDLSKALTLALAATFTAAGSFLQHPTHDDGPCDVATTATSPVQADDKPDAP